MLAKIFGEDVNNSCWLQRLGAEGAEKEKLFFETITHLRLSKAYDALAKREGAKHIEFEVILASDRLYAYQTFRALGFGKPERTAEDKWEELNNFLTDGYKKPFYVQHPLLSKVDSLVRTNQITMQPNLYTADMLTAIFTLEGVDAQAIKTKQIKDVLNKSKAGTASTASKTKTLESPDFGKPPPETPAAEGLKINSPILDLLNEQAGNVTDFFAKIKKHK